MVNIENKEQEQLREMNFTGGEIDYGLENDIKLVSLRMPDVKYDFAVGEVINANCLDIQGKKIRLVVIDNLKKQLNEFWPAELLLDGYLSAEEAAADLRTFGPKYEGVTEDTTIQAVMTMTEDRFLELAPEIKERIIKDGAESLLNDVDRPMVEIFYPALCRWVVAKGGGLRDYWGFLAENDMLYLHEEQAAEAAYVRGEVPLILQPSLLEIWEGRDGEHKQLFEKVVLFKFSD